ncbi:MAG: helix-turn-helix domain-containing protein [bacterium]
MNTPLPLPVDRAIKKLGADLSLARRRRKMTQAMLAERLGTSIMTVRRMEGGHPGTALQYLARALQVFGALEKLNALLDSSQDTVGLIMMDERVPVRVRKPKQGKGVL